MPHRHDDRQEKTRILVAEDSATQAERIRAILAGRGYDVVIAGNGKEALESARENPPTLVISDVLMPEMDGYELCRHLKDLPTLRDIPVLLLTSLSDPADVVRGLECGADNFIVKPYDERNLLSRIAFMMAHIRVRESDASQMGIEIYFGGKTHFITSDRLQILNLLLSTYESAVQKNMELLRVQDELRLLTETLDDRVRERTARLQSEMAAREQLAEELSAALERERSLLEQVRRLQQAQ